MANGRRGTGLIGQGLVLSVVLVGCSGQPTSQRGADPPKDTDDQVTAKLEEVVALKEKLVTRWQQPGLAEGAAEDALIDLWEARVRLAQAKGDTKGVTEALQGIVEVRRRGLERAQLMETVGTAVWTDVAQAKCKLLDAEVRLLEKNR